MPLTLIHKVILAVTLFGAGQSLYCKYVAPSLSETQAKSSVMTQTYQDVQRSVSGFISSLRPPAPAPRVYIGD